MEYNLKDFTGGYSCLPDAIGSIVSPEASLLFSKLYFYGCKLYNTALVAQDVSMSISNLQKVTGLGKIKITNATKELEDFRFLSVSGSRREKRFYHFNWEEIHLAYETLSPLSFDGIAAIRELCTKDNAVTPISMLNPDETSKISIDYKFNWDGFKSSVCGTSKISIDNDENRTQQTNDSDPSMLISHKTSKISIDEKDDAHQISIENPSMLKLNKSSEISIDEKDDDAQSMLISHKTSKISIDDSRQYTQNQHRLFKEDDGTITLNVFLDNGDAILAEEKRIHKVNLCRFSPSMLILQSIYADFDTFTPKTCENQHTVNIYNKYTQKENNNPKGLEGNNCIEGFRCNSSLDRLVESINRLKKTLSVAKCFSVGGQNKTATNFSEAGEESTEDFQLEQQNKADPWNEDEETSSFDSTEGEESDSEEIVEEDEENSQLEKPERDSGFSAWKVDPLNIAPKDNEDENPRRNHVSSTPKADEIYRKQKEERKKLEAFQNMFKNKPYFKPWEVDEILADVESCKSSPVKYFINILWYDLEAIWKEDCETKRLPADDEEPGKTIPMSDVVTSMERYYFDRKTVEDAVERAWKTMTKEVGVGYVMTNNGKLELDMREEDIPDNINVMGIVDWELINDGKGYLVDSRRFRNIEAEDAVELKTPRTRAEYAAERKRNRGFCKLVSSMDDSQLTPMEIAVKNFMNTYVNTDEWYHLTGGFKLEGNPHSPSIPGYTMQMVVYKLCHGKDGKFTIEMDDFYGVIAMNKPKKLMNGMILSSCDFDFCSFDAVRRWNQMNGFQSNVKEEDFKLASLTQDLEAV